MIAYLEESCCLKNKTNKKAPKPKPNSGMISVDQCFNHVWQKWTEGGVGAQEATISSNQRGEEKKGGRKKEKRSKK